MNALEFCEGGVAAGMVGAGVARCIVRFVRSHGYLVGVGGLDGRHCGRGRAVGGWRGGSFVV